MDRSGFFYARIESSYNTGGLQGMDTTSIGAVVGVLLCCLGGYYLVNKRKDKDSEKE
jgi:hypothetical protein